MSTPPNTLPADPHPVPFASSCPDQQAVPQQRHKQDEEGEAQQETGNVITTSSTTTTTNTTSPRLQKSRSYPPMAPRSSSNSHHRRDFHFQLSPPFRRPPSPPSDSSPAALSRLLHTFDETLRTRLRSLLPVPATTTLSYLSRVIEILRSIHADVAQVISDPSLHGADDAAVSAYLDCSVALLDSCNAASARIDRLLRRRLLLALALHHLLLSDGAHAERVQKARKAVEDWEQQTDAAADEEAGDAPEWTSRTGGHRIKGVSFPRDPPPSGKSSAIARAVYAVEAVSAIVGGILIRSLFGESAGSVRVRKVSAEFGWADAYNDLRKAISSCSVKSCSPAEVSAVESRARDLSRALEGTDGAPPHPDDIRGATEALEKEMERLTEGLGTLAGTVNGLFRAAMGARNAAVEGLRLDRKNCKVGE